ncbi:MAG: acetyl-CoA carboxylase biotin carboxyl carrier protein subunit [Chloroflexota bacterium]|jgi:biotin carboxyl carrier protein|nr:acetyl-CoA carboxylase biotin carboxyl carrier protein subunit [Anaerolineae bacterium]HMM28839.1 acetyl-CoA carboxylase biotin carboxyl carrier protein subunit [Aggregatilineaceae bacterium]
MKYQATVNGRTFEVEINEDGRVLIDNEPRSIDFCELREGELYSLLVDHLSYEAVVEERDDLYHVLMAGDLYEVKVTDERSRRLASAFMAFGDVSGEVAIRAPMPGLIVRVPVVEGQAVAKGDTVILLESMKMENELKAPRDGTIHRVSVRAGDSVEQNKVLITIA